MSTLGFDAGGTFLKFGSMEKVHLLPLPYTKELLTNLLTPDIQRIILTGAGSKTIVKWFQEVTGISSNVNFQVYNEFMATGLGGAFLADVQECIVVNIGSGTPILYVNSKINHVDHIAGTGLGSASLVGLAHFILNISDLEKIADLALRGDPNNVNLLVGDLYDHSKEDLGLPSDITASNFGKYQDWRNVKTKPNNSDLLAGLHVLVAETISVIASQSSKAYTSGLPIVLTGGGTMNRALVKYLLKTFTYLERKVIVPNNAIYATLNGLFILDKLKIPNY